MVLEESTKKAKEKYQDDGNGPAASCVPMWVLTWVYTGYIPRNRCKMGVCTRWSQLACHSD